MKCKRGELTILSVVTLIGVMVILAGSALPSEKTSQPNAIIGEWQEVGGTLSRMVFLKDGYLTVAAGKQQLAGRYKFLDKNRLLIDYGGNVGSMIFEVSISGDELVLTEPNGNVSKFKRVK